VTYFRAYQARCIIIKTAIGRMVEIKFLWVQIDLIAFRDQRWHNEVGSDGDSGFATTSVNDRLINIVNRQ